MTVSVMDQRLTVRSDSDEEELARVSAYVNRKIGEVADRTRNPSALTSALLACMNIARDYLQLSQRQEQASCKIRELIGEIDGGCQGESRISP